jgi:hypothetical protein
LCTSFGTGVTAPEVCTTETGAKGWQTCAKSLDICRSYQSCERPLKAVQILKKIQTNSWTLVPNNLGGQKEKSWSLAEAHESCEGSLNLVPEPCMYIHMFYRTHANVPRSVQTQYTKSCSMYVCLTKSGTNL